VFAVDGHEFDPVFPHKPCYERSGRHQGFLVGQGDPFPVADGLGRRAHSGETHQGRDHHIDIITPDDRIQAFGADHRVMYQFGRSGTEPGEFLRPQAMAYDAERDELYVVDSGNHRVQVFTSDGELRRTLGRPGMAAGELSYPFGLTLLIGGRAIDALGHPVGAGVDRDAPRAVALAEHGNHRVQVLDGRTGESLAIAGGIGRERGRLKYPWAIEPAGIGAGGVQRFAVCDHGNSRIVFCTIPFASGPGSTPPAPPASTTR